jgi:hypothetical protein
MALSLSSLATSRGGNWPSETLRSYVVRYRHALYVLPIAVVVAGIALEWHWLKALPSSIFCRSEVNP